MLYGTNYNRPNPFVLKTVTMLQPWQPKHYYFLSPLQRVQSRSVTQTAALFPSPCLPRVWALDFAALSLSPSKCPGFVIWSWQNGANNSSCSYDHKHSGMGTNTDMDRQEPPARAWTLWVYNSYFSQAPGSSLLAASGAWKAGMD